MFIYSKKKKLLNWACAGQKGNELQTAWPETLVSGLDKSEGRVCPRDHFVS